MHNAPTTVQTNTPKPPRTSTQSTTTNSIHTPTTASLITTTPPSPAKPNTATSQSLPPLIHFAGGAVGAMTGAMLTSPLDVAKTRMQSMKFSGSVIAGTAVADARAVAWRNAMNSPSGFRTVNVLRCIIKHEGPTSVFRGLGPSIAGVAPLRAMYFTLYSSFKNLAPVEMQDRPVVHLMASIASGVVTSSVGCPLWVVKTRMQLQTNTKEGYRNSLHCLRRIIREEGVRPLFRGLVASYWGITETALQFVVYEQLKRTLLPSQPSLGGSNKPTDANSRFAAVELLAIAAAAKLFAIAVAYPHEVVRTRVREPEWPSHVRSFVHCLKHIAQCDGVGALYKGMGVHMLRSVPNSALMFLTYEGVCHLYREFLEPSPQF